MIESLFTLLLPILIGLFTCTLLAMRVRRFWVVVWMAPAVGVGICSVLFFLWSLVFYPSFQSKIYLVLEGLLLAVLIGVTWRMRASLPVLRPRLRVNRWEWVMVVPFLIVLAFFAYRFVEQTMQSPLGSWDAWTIWNYRARYLLFGSADTWRNVFSLHVNHADYPYLLSGFIARCWVLIGKDRTIVPVFTEVLFTVSTIGLLTAAVAQFRGLGTGLLAGTLLASLPIFLITSSMQYSDLEVAFYFLAALVCLYEYFTGSLDPTWLSAAGALTAFSLWTKNEGFSFFISLIAALFLVQLWARTSWKTILHRFVPFAIGLLPVTMLVLAYKFWLAPATDLFENRPISAILLQLTDISRFRSLVGMILRSLLSYGLWKIPFLPFLTIYIIAAGIRKMRSEEKTGLWVIGGVLVLTYLQYMGIYLISPHDLTWHVSTSIGRLYNQLLPGFIFMIFLLVRSAFENQPDPIDLTSSKMLVDHPGA